MAERKRKPHYGDPLAETVSEEEAEYWVNSTMDEQFNSSPPLEVVPSGEPYPVNLEFEELPPHIKKMFNKEGWDYFRSL